MALGKYRHKVTGKVVEVDDRYAAAIKAFEPVSQDTRVDIYNCCGGGLWNDEDEEQELESAGVDTTDWPATDEPTDENEGE